MKRTPLGMLILAGLILTLTVPYVAGREEDPETIDLADLKTDVLRKMVGAHAAEFARDKSRGAKVKALADTLGGSASVANQLNYTFKDDKPSIELDATRVMKNVSAADREAALAAVKDLVGYSLGKVAAGSVTVGDKKFTLPKDDVKTLAAAVRVFWPAAVAPPPVKPNPALAAQLAQLARDLENLKKLDARIGKLEKDAPGLGKKIDDLAAEVKKLAEAVKPLDKLRDVPANLDKVEKAVGKLTPAVQKLEEAVKKLDPLPGQVKAIEGQLKALADRADKQEKSLADANAAIKKQADEARVLADSAAGRIKALEDRAKKDSDERKKLNDRLKKLEAAHFPPPPPPQPAPQYRVIDRGYYILKPSVGRGCFGECFPVLTPVWVPCPVVVPVLPSIVEEKNDHWKDDDDKRRKEKDDAERERKEKKDREKLPNPKQDDTPAGEGPLLPDTTPVSLTRTASIAKPAASTPTPTGRAVPVYHTDGLKADDAPALYWQGKKLYHAGQYDEAQARFDAAIRLADGDARYWYFKSLCESARGEKGAAAQSLRRAVELHLQGKPTQALISEALERVQGTARRQLRDALDARRVSR